MFRLTKEEKTVLLFLLASLFVGIGVLYYKKLNPTPPGRGSINLATRQAVKFDKRESENYKKVNINEATRRELIRIRNVGPVLADRIVSYREEHGLFRDVEEIRNVRGIGDKTYEKIEKQITVE